MSELFLTHQTKQGDRWDLLANKYYGDVCKMNLLLRANPQLSFLEVLPAGVAVFVPVIKKEPAQTDLPPWLREDSE